MAAKRGELDLLQNEFKAMYQLPHKDLEREACIKKSIEEIKESPLWVTMNKAAKVFQKMEGKFTKLEKKMEAATERIEQKQKEPDEAKQEFEELRKAQEEHKVELVEARWACSNSF